MPQTTTHRLGNHVANIPQSGNLWGGPTAGSSRKSQVPYKTDMLLLALLRPAVFFAISEMTRETREPKVSHGHCWMHGE